MSTKNSRGRPSLNLTEEERLQRRRDARKKYYRLHREKELIYAVNTYQEKIGGNYKYISKYSNKNEIEV